MTNSVKPYYEVCGKRDGLLRKIWQEEEGGRLENDLTYTADEEM